MITNIVKNKYIDGNKSERFLFELTSQDLEQLMPHEILGSLEQIKRELNQLKVTELLKIYYLDRKIYLDASSSKMRLPYFASKPFLKGLAPFTMGENVFSDPVLRDDYCKFNGIYFRFISIGLKDDHQIDINGLQKFGDFFITFKKVRTLFSKMMVNDARKLSHTSLYSALSDIEGIETYKENEEMLRKIITRDEELFRSDVFFVIRAKTEGELQEHTELLVDELNTEGLSPKIETASINNVFKSFFPGLKPTFQKPLLFHTSLIANLLPTHQDVLMPTGVVFHSRSNSELKFDLRDGDNNSAIFIGVSGSGKTVLVQKILSNELKQKRKCFIIDPKHDYRKFALLENAHIIDSSINPMIFHDPIYLRNMILSKIPKNERTALWEGQLLRAIRETEAYECKNFFKALEKIKPKGFPDLEYYFEDVVDKISDKLIELKDFTYIELESFTNESIPFLLSFAFEYVKRLNAPYNLVIDEAHRVFKHDPTFLEERVREMRVQNASLITITQKYKDLVSNYFGEIVADNSFHKMFFKQQIETEKGIDSFDQINIKSLHTVKGEYSEFYYKSDIHRKIMRYYPTLKELEVFKSGNVESDQMLKYIREKLELFTVDEAINLWVRDKYAL